MSSTFLGLNTAYTGLQAANAALNTTANNISNAETVGYSRQLVTTQAAEAIRAFSSYGCIGAGVETLAIERVRDNFYDEKFWANNSKLGEYESKQYYMSCIEEYYCDDDSIKGFNTIFNEFYGSIEELSKNPGDTTVRQQAIGYAGNVTSYFNDMYTNLRKLQDDVNQEIKVNIDRINSISTEIAALNKQINVIEMNTGAMANDLRDQRDLLIDELSEIVSVEVTETPIIDMTNTERDTGGTRYSVKICGQPMIDGNYCKSLKCIPRANYEAVNQTDIDGLYDVFFEEDETWTLEDYRTKGDQLNMYAPTTGGKLGGLIAMRDGNNAEGFAGKVVDLTEDLKNQMVTIEVKKDYLIDLNKLNLTTSGGIINIGNTLYNFTNWDYNYTEGNDFATYTFYLPKQTPDIEGDIENKKLVPLSAQSQEYEATIGSSIAYQGIPYYLSQMNQWVRMYSTAFNEILREGVTDQGEQGGNLFTSSSLSTGKDGDFNYYEDCKDNGVTNYSITTNTAGDPNNAITHTYYNLTAGNFKISEDLIKDANKLATRTLQYSGKDDNDVVKKIIDLKTNTAAMNFRGCSADQYLICMLSDVSLNAQRANDFTDNYKVLRKSIDNQRLSVSGVDNDEEAVNLTKFQQQYNLASKMIQTLTEIYDRLILQTGV